MFEEVQKFYSYCQKQLSKTIVSVNVVTDTFDETEIVDALAFCGAIVYEGKPYGADARIEKGAYYLNDQEVPVSAFASMEIKYSYSNARIKKDPD